MPLTFPPGGTGAPAAPSQATFGVFIILIFLKLVSMSLHLVVVWGTFIFMNGDVLQQTLVPFIFPQFPQKNSIFK